MASPFPGMDPYLEDPGIWPDFHAKFINYLQESLGDRLPEHYVARVREQIRLVDPDEGQARRYEPDVDIVKTDGMPGRPRSDKGAILLEPTLVEMEDPFESRELSIEIIHF